MLSLRLVKLKISVDFIHKTVNKVYADCLKIKKFKTEARHFVQFVHTEIGKYVSNLELLVSVCMSIWLTFCDSRRISKLLTIFIKMDSANLANDR